MSKILTFWSVNGGVGKTTLSSNISYNIAKRNPDKNVLLLDFNLVNPDTSSYLNIKPLDLKELHGYFSTNTMNREILENHLKTHPKQKNFKILSGLYDFTFFEKFITENFTLIIELAKQIGYDYIIIDIDSSLNIDATLVALISATTVQIVTDGLYHSLSNTIRYLDNYLSKINITDENINIIINKYESEISNKTEIKTLLNSKNIFFIEYSKIFPQSINEGIPIVEKKDKKAKSIIEQVNHITDHLTKI